MGESSDVINNISADWLVKMKFQLLINSHLWWNVVNVLNESTPRIIPI